MAILNTGVISRVDAVHIMAGCMVMLGVALTYFVHDGFLIIPAFVAANLFQYGFTGFCPAENIFGKVGLPEPTCPSTATEKKVSLVPTHESIWK